MAWESITWSCGHKTRKQLYGPNLERERFVEWAGREGSCQDCHREDRRKADREAGPAFVVRETERGVEFACWRDSYAIRDTLEERGYRFGEVYGPDLRRNLTHGPVKGWSLIAPADEWVEDEAKWIIGEGFEVAVQDTAARLVSAAIEGRPDLVGASG